MYIETENIETFGLAGVVVRGRSHGGREVLCRGLKGCKGCAAELSVSQSATSLPRCECCQRAIWVATCPDRRHQGKDKNGNTTHLKCGSVAWIRLEAYWMQRDREDFVQRLDRLDDVRRRVARLLWDSVE